MMYMTYLYLYGSRLERHELRSDLRSAQSYHASDGLLTPETLVHRAVEMRVARWRLPIMTPQLRFLRQEKKFHVAGWP